jgi:biotin carboxylase
MKKILLLSRQPLATRPVHRWLDNAAGSVILLTTADALVGAERVAKEQFLDFHLVDEYFASDTEQAAAAIARQHVVGLIASTSEDDVLRAARLRGRLGLFGQSVDSATAYRDKLVMKGLVAGAGLAVPTFAALERPADLSTFVQVVGLPVVVKPRLGSGSVGVTIVRTPDQLAELLRDGRWNDPTSAGSWMVERFVDAPFFHVDGVMAAGRVIHCWPGRYSGGNEEAFRANDMLSSRLLDPADPQRRILQEFAGAVVRTLPPTPTPSSFHLEAWLPASGRPVLCEIACRTGGGPIAPTYERAFGVEPTRESLRGQCGQDLTLDHQPDAPRAHLGWVMFPPGQGRFAPPTDPCPVPGVDITLRMAAGASAEGMHDAGHSAAFAIVEGTSAAQVNRRIAELRHWWRNGCRWLDTGSAARA